MRALSKLLLLLLVAISIAAIVTAACCQTTSIADAHDAIIVAYNAVVDASNKGADVSELTGHLNQAITLTEQAQAQLNINASYAQNLATQAQTIAENVTSQALILEADNTITIITAVTVAVLVAVGVIVYFFGPKVFWKLWLTLRKNYRVKVKNLATHNKGLIITGEQICAVVLGLTVVIALVAASPFFLPKTTGEQFSELGLLGPNMTLGDYPSQIVAGNSVNLFIYVGNQMGQPIYYTVLVKLGDNTTIAPASSQSIQEYSQVLPNNGNWTFPVSITLDTPGLNQRILFELWIYNQTLNQIQYHERWVHLSLNVTAPAT